MDQLPQRRLKRAEFGSRSGGKSVVLTALFDSTGVRPEGIPRTLVVMGASAGGVETLRRVVADLPADLAAAVCVVLHIAPGAPSALAAILARAGPLPCRAVGDHERLRAGEILVAPPDRHVIIDDGHVSLSSGPRENGHRPAVDALFRTAAQNLDGRVIGVVLSGTQDDGTSGLALIKSLGGLAVVQDPEEAIYAGMPTNAIAHVSVDAVVPSDEIANTIVRMVNGDWGGRAGGDDDPAPQDLGGEPVVTTCPECGGVLSEYRQAGLTQWQSKVGHRYSPESLADAQAEDVEATVWAAIRSLEDRHQLLERMAQQSTSRGFGVSARLPAPGRAGANAGCRGPSDARPGDGRDPAPGRGRGLRRA
jgi:two-component system, chemotaxis family, protein-glutamate methylesterase/glutaminase